MVDVFSFLGSRIDDVLYASMDCGLHCGEICAVSEVYCVALDVGDYTKVYLTAQATSTANHAHK